MEVTVGLFILIIALAFVCELIDSSLGMGYGTILSPVLIIMGFEPLVVVPAVLLSQAFGGLSASVFHHQFENASFHYESKDLKIVFIISGFGIIATIFAALTALNIPKVVLQTYIGILVFVMGVIILYNKKYDFSWNKIIALGIISSFNKGLSGGGFGPVVTGGQILAGHNYKGAVGVTTLAEAPICIASFVTYLIAKTVKEADLQLLSMPLKQFIVLVLSPEIFNWELMIALIIGSVMVGPFGALTTKKLNDKYIHIVLGIFIIMLGIWTLIKTYY